MNKRFAWMSAKFIQFRSDVHRLLSRRVRIGVAMAILMLWQTGPTPVAASITAFTRMGLASNLVGQTPAVLDISGTWLIGSYTAKLYQSGTAITGTKVYGGATYTVTGTVNGYSFTGSFTAGGATYPFNATIAPDGKSWTGFATGWGPWNGVFQPGVILRLTPTAPAILKAGDTKTYTAEVGGSLDKGVVWSATAGSVVDGVYTVPSGYDYTAQTITAEANADRTKKATAQVSITPTGIIDVSGTYQDSYGQVFTLFQNGINIRGTRGGQAFEGTLDGLTLTGVQRNADSSVSINFIWNYAPDGNSYQGLWAYGTGTPSSSWTGTRQPGVVVQISPVPPQIAKPGAVLQFSAQVAGSPNKEVTWSATAGSVTDGSYIVPSGYDYTVQTITVAANADRTKKATAQVSITPTGIIDVSGTYQDSYGQVFTLFQNGTSIRGTRSGQAFEGTLAGLTLTGVQRNADSSVNINFIWNYAPDGNSYQGLWAYGTGIPSLSWTGTRQPGVVVQISPVPPQIAMPGAVLQFSAQVAGSPNKEVTWSATAGSVVNGVYTVPSGYDYTTQTVTATSSADSTKKVSSQVSITPTGVMDFSGTYTGGSQSMLFYQSGTTITGTFTYYSTTPLWTIEATLNGYALTGLIRSVTNQTTTYTLSGTFSPDGLTFTGTTGYAGAWVGTKQPGISMRISPSAPTTLKAGDTKTYTAEVAGTPNKSIAWSATGGTIANGLYTASMQGEQIITARSVADPSASVEARVYVDTWKHPFASWSFEEASGMFATDGTGHGFTGRLVNFPVRVVGKTGNGLTFDGKSTYVDVPHPFTFTGPFTVTAWVKFGAVNRGSGLDNAILGSGSAATNQGLHLSERGGKPYFGFYSNDLVGQAALKPDCWTHLAFTWDGSSKRIYVNGILDASQNSSAYQGTAQNTRIGAYAWGAFDTFLGTLDEVAIYNRGLTDPEVAALYASTVNLMVSPRAASLAIGQSQPFIASVAGSENATVAWELPDVGSGSINAQGVYTAPASVPASGATYRVVARSAAEPSQTDTVTVTVKPYVRVWPESVSVAANGTYPFNAEVTGLANPAVTWSATGGTFNGNIYTAPSATGTYTITATSVADGSKTATATVMVISGSVPANGGLVGYWTFNGNALDSSGNNNHATLSNGAIFANGKLSSGARFDGLNASADIPSVNCFLGPFTVSAWVKFDAVSKGTDNAILGHGTNATNQGLHLGERNGKAYFGFYGNDLAGSSPLQAGLWTHLTFVYNGTQKRIYVNGAVDATQNSAAYQSSLTNAQIGRYGWSSGSISTCLGIIDEVRVYNRALSDAEVSGLVTASTNVTITPHETVVSLAQTQAFSAQVTGNSNTAVTWSLPSGAGTITSTGVFAPPATISGQGTQYSVRATSQAVTSQYDTAWVTVNYPVYVTPRTLTLPANGRAQFTAETTGLASSQVTWTASAGTISTSGLFLAPATPGTVTITATSVSDGTKSGAATVTVAKAGTTPDVHLAFDEGTGTATTDSMGSGVVGTLNNGVAWVSGKLGQGVSFPNSNSLVLLSPVLKLGPAWTLSAWFSYPLPATGTYHTLTRGYSGDHQILVNTDQVSLGCWDNSTAFRDSGFKMNTLATGWHHVAAVGIGGTTRFYIDGQAVGNVIPWQSATDVYAVGNYQGGGQVFGTLDEFKYFQRALGDVEIASLALGSKVQITPGSAVLAPGAKQTFSATVAGLTNPAVTWELPDLRSGSITSAGIYTAPNAIPYDGIKFRVLARSVQDPLQTAMAWVTVARASAGLGPLLHLPFHEGSGTKTQDTSGHGFQGTLVNNPAWSTAGKVGNALSFSGTQHVQVPAFPALTKSLSASLWIHPTGNGTNNPQGGLLLGREGEFVLARFQDGTIRYAFRNAVPGWIYTSTGYIAPLNQWTHLVLTYESSTGRIELYANGSLVYSLTGSGAIQISTPAGEGLQIGRRQLNSSFYQGLLDEIRLYDRVISAEEVTALYNLAAVEVYPSEVGTTWGRQLTFQAVVPGNADQRVTWELPVSGSGSIATDGTYTAPASGDNAYPVVARSVADPTRTGTALVHVRSGTTADNALVGHWPFQEYSGTNVADVSQVNNPGKITDGPVTWGSGVIGNALVFDGAHGQVTIPNHLALNSASLTISLWLRLDKDPAFDSSTNSWRSILHKGDFYGTPTGYAINLEKNRAIGFDTGTGTSDRWWPAGMILPIGRWTNLVLSYDAATGLKAAYQDGVLMDTKRVAPGPLKANTSPLYLNNPSAYLPSGYGNFPGAMDELKVYNQALTASDLAPCYDLPLTVRIEPMAVTLTPGQTQVFKARVTGTANTAVSWSVLDSGRGTIDANGLYTAPASISSQGARIRVRAVSAASSSRSDTVYVTLKKPVYVTPATVSVPVNGQVAFSAEVTGLSGTGVAWSTSGGSISTTGVLTAPGTAGAVTVTATSTADSTKSATATVTVTSATTAAGAHFPFTEGTGTTTLDVSGHGYLGTLQNGAQWADGYLGKGLDVRGNANAWMVLNPIVELGEAWTLSSWFSYPLDATGTWHSLARGASMDHQILVHSDQVSLGLWDSMANTWRGCGYSLVNLGAGWHQVTAVGVQGTTTFYVDGQPVGTPVPYQSKSDVAYVGGNALATPAQTFGGVLDDFKAFPRALGPAEISQQFNATLNVTAKPANPTLILGQAQAFTATVTGTSNQAVTWSVQESAGGAINAATGAYTAPASIPAEGTVYHVVATSQADPTKKAVIPVTVRSPIVIAPAVASVKQGASVTFTATTTNLASTAVKWSVVQGGGTIHPDTGVYTAPSLAGIYTITATSVSDPSKTGTAMAWVPAAISIVPAKASVVTGGPIQYVAQVTGLANTGVNWFVWEPKAGSITPSGYFTASTNPGSTRVTAATQTEPQAAAIAEVNVVRDAFFQVDPNHVRIKPGAKVAFKVLGPDVGLAQIVWSASGGSITSSGIFTAPATEGTCTVSAIVTTDRAQVVGALVIVASGAPVDSVTVSPSGITLPKGGTTTFTAEVNGGVTGSVTWSCDGGAIDPATGAYTAPATVGTYTVKATSTEDGNMVGAATVTVKESVGSDKTFTYDANGNLTSDGERTFEWDAENRLIAVVIVATGHRSEFGYDGLGRRVEIIEKDANVITSDKTYLWDGVEIAEERDATGGTVQKRFYSQGFVDSDGTKLFYTRDHLGSIRELTDSTQAVRARYDYDPYGRMTKVQGDRDSVFQYAGYFWHAQSGLNLTLYRAYDPNMGRWISRDPISEQGGMNVYAYVSGNPIYLVDPLGLCDQTGFQRCMLDAGLAKVTAEIAALQSYINAMNNLKWNSPSDPPTIGGLIGTTGSVVSMGWSLGEAGSWGSIPVGVVLTDSVAAALPWIGAGAAAFKVGWDAGKIFSDPWESYKNSVFQLEMLRDSRLADAELEYQRAVRKCKKKNCC